MATVQITLKGFVHKRKYGEGFSFYQCDMSEYGDILIGPHTLEFSYDLPDEWNETAARVDILNKQKDVLAFEFNRRVMQINEEISKLQCLEFDEATA